MPKFVSISFAKSEDEKEVLMIPDTLLIVDLETTGLDPIQDQVIELGAILYSVPHCCTLQQFSTLFPVATNAAEKINRISVEASQIIKDIEIPLLQFELWVTQADYLVAHNADFDRKWFGHCGLPTVDKPWLCTYQDFIWDKNHKPASLINTALNHGIGVSHAHRALTDCQLIAAIFDRVGAEFNGIGTFLERAIKRSKEPPIIVVANVSYDDRELAKKQGFIWNKYIERKWAKQIKRSDFLIERETYPFPYDVETF
jgi:DNA polymerase-3 subunit epsilon